MISSPSDWFQFLLANNVSHVVLFICDACTQYLYLTAEIIFVEKIFTQTSLYIAVD